MICPNCGKDGGEGKYCIGCGAQLPAGMVRVEKPQKSSSNVLLIVILIVLVLAIVGVAGGLAAYLVISNQNAETESVDDEDDEGDDEEPEDTDQPGDEEQPEDGKPGEEVGEAPVAEVATEEAPAAEIKGQDAEDAYQTLMEYANGLSLVPNQEIKKMIEKVDDGLVYINGSIQAGPIAWSLRDFDGNGVDELLVIETTFDRNLIFEMYAAKDGDVVSATHYEAENDLSGYFNDCSAGAGDVFVFDLADGTYGIGVEQSEIESTIGDGTGIYLLTLKYDGRFSVLGNASCAGSDFYEEPSGFVSELKKAGLNNPNWRDLVEIRTIPSDYVKNPEYLVWNAMTDNASMSAYDWYRSASANDELYGGPHYIMRSDGRSCIEFNPKTSWYAQSEYTAGQFFPDSDSRYLQESELYDLSKDDLSYARNEMYARHGRKFKDKKLMNYFGQFDWYDPYIEPDDFKDTDYFNQYELYNRDLISKYEKKMGYR